MNSRNFIFRMVLALSVLAMCVMPMKAQSDSILGDVDGNGNVNIDDLTALIDYLLSSKERSDELMLVADVDNNGVIDISDLADMIDYILFGKWPGEQQPRPVSYTVNGVTFEMMPVAGGTFTMGANDGDTYARPWEKPAHEVTLSDYYIGVTEVTQALWMAVMITNPSWYSGGNGYVNNYQRPVERVSYEQCQTFIAKLNQMTGLTFRMPTEAEWEYAARGGNMSKGYLYAGSDDIEEVSWHKGNSSNVTHVVATKAPNELGLYDMSGNVAEWCSDWYDANYYSISPVLDPQGPSTGGSYVYRGGSWDQAFRMSRVSCRIEGFPESGTVNNGLRLAM